MTNATAPRKRMEYFLWKKKRKRNFTCLTSMCCWYLLLSYVAVATWILPAGEFDREPNESGTELVVPGTYHEVEQSLWDL